MLLSNWVYYNHFFLHSALQDTLLFCASISTTGATAARPGEVVDAVFFSARTLSKTIATRVSSKLRILLRSRNSRHCLKSKVLTITRRESWNWVMEGNARSQKIVDVGSVVEAVSAEDGDAPLYSLDSLCMRCGENVSFSHFPPPLAFHLAFQWIHSVPFYFFSHLLCG